MVGWLFFGSSGIKKLKGISVLHIERKKEKLDPRTKPNGAEVWLELEERGTSVHTGEGSTSSLQPCKEASSCREPKSLPLFTQKITAPNAPHHHRDAPGQPGLPRTGDRGEPCSLLSSGSRRQQGWDPPRRASSSAPPGAWNTASPSEARQYNSKSYFTVAKERHMSREV